MPHASSHTPSGEGLQSYIYTSVCCECELVGGMTSPNKEQSNAGLFCPVQKAWDDLTHRCD